ncbi:Pentulose kinase [Amanita muscaria]
MTDYYIGIDVGTGSARAILVGEDGSIVASSTQEIITYRDPEDHRIFEQSTTNIWAAICKTIQGCLSDGAVAASSVKGIGFDATCSLAVTNFNGEPVTVTRGDQLGQHGERNIVLWADHRAEEEAELINSTGSEVLDYVGGTMSLEMECPKMLWLKKHMDPSLFARCQFFDLPDFLTYRATSDDMRSSCSLTCKCSYIPDKGWRADFFQKIGLGEFVERNYKPVGAADGSVLTAGMPVGRGLSKKAAQELGLVEGTPVGSALIDAYAGWVGTVAARYKENSMLSEPPSIGESQHRLAVVAGTSTCHIVQSPAAVFVNGVWGPYKDAVFRSWWMNEGGQSSTGQLIEFILTTHPAYPQLVEQGKRANQPIHAVLEDILQNLRTERGVETNIELTKDVHFYPDFHGNRSPVADARMRGSIVGLDLDVSIADLARKYYLTLESICLQTRHIIDCLNAKTSNSPNTSSIPSSRQDHHNISTIYMSGGQAKNRALMQLLADVCKMPVVLPADSGAAVVLGSAILGRFAREVSDWHASHEGNNHLSEAEQNEMLWRIMVNMTPSGVLVAPTATPKEARLLEAKYDIFHETIGIQKRWRRQMEKAVQ